ncbi:TonB-dependent receptor [bacterium]|nr:TonB-dependent receptor [bacterium]
MERKKYFAGLFALIMFFTGFIFFARAGWKDSVQPEELFAMSLRELMDVEMEIVTAGKIPEKIGEVPASVVLIEREDIEATGFQTLADVLSHIPGLFPIDDYSYDGVNFGVRGFWTGVVNRNIIILVNGVNQLSDYGANFPLNKINVPVEAIDRIEVIRGPMSVVYGTGAFFGVINIVTNEINKGNTVSLFSVSGGSQGQKKAVLRISDKIESFQYVVNASIYQTEGPDVPFTKLMNHPESLVNYNLSKDHTTHKQLENVKKYFNVSGRSDQIFFDFSFAQTDKEIYMVYPSYSDGSLFTSTAVNMAIGYKRPFNKFISLNSRLSYHYARYGVDWNFFMDHFDMQQFLGESAYEFECNINYHANDKLDITTGLQYRSSLDIDNTVSAPSIGDPGMLHTRFYLYDDSKIITRALFSQANFTPISRLKVVGGLRLEQMPDHSIGYSLAPSEAGQPASVSQLKYSYNTWEAIPRAAVLYNINKNNIVKLLYGEAINRPSFQQYIDNFLGIQKSLKPEKIKTYEINYMVSLFSGFTAGINIFRNEMTDLLSRDQGFNPGYYSFFSNVGKMRTHGTEITIIAESVDKKLNVEASITYQQTEDQRQPDIDVAYSPNWLGYLKATYKPMENYTFSLTARYVDRMLPYWDSSPLDTSNSESPPVGRIGDSVKGYVNVGANFRVDHLLNTKCYLNIRGSNLLNTEIYYPTFTNNRWADRGTLGEPRTFLVTFGIQY